MLGPRNTKDGENQSDGATQILKLLVHITSLKTSDGSGNIRRIRLSENPEEVCCGAQSDPSQSITVGSFIKLLKESQNASEESRKRVKSLFKKYIHTITKHLNRSEKKIVKSFPDGESARLLNAPVEEITTKDIENAVVSYKKMEKQKEELKAEIQIKEQSGMPFVEPAVKKIEKYMFRKIKSLQKDLNNIFQGNPNGEDDSQARTESPEVQEGTQSSMVSLHGGLMNSDVGNFRIY